jgi:hypothetical protein
MPALPALPALPLAPARPLPPALPPKLPPVPIGRSKKSFGLEHAAITNSETQAAAPRERAGFEGEATIPRMMARRTARFNSHRSRAN